MRFGVLAAACALMVSSIATHAGSAEKPLMVVDANGKTVGRLGTVAGTYAFARFEGSLASLKINSNFGDGTLIFEHAGGVQFATTDCTGTAYIFQPAPTGAAPTSVVLANGRLSAYVADSPKWVSVSLRSRLGQDGCQSTGIEEPQMAAVVSRPPVDLSAYFTEPLSIK